MFYIHECGHMCFAYIIICEDSICMCVCVRTYVFFIHQCMHMNSYACTYPRACKCKYDFKSGHIYLVYIYVDIYKVYTCNIYLSG